MQANIDIDRLNKAVAEGFTKHADTFGRKDVDARAMIGEERGLEDIASTFCTSWPRVRGFLLMAINSFGWLAPKQAALAKSVIDAIHKVVVPAICGAK